MHTTRRRFTGLLTTALVLTGCTAAESQPTTTDSAAVSAAFAELTTAGIVEQTPSLVECTLGALNDRGVTLAGLGRPEPDLRPYPDVAAFAVAAVECVGPAALRAGLVQMAASATDPDAELETSIERCVERVHTSELERAIAAVLVTDPARLSAALATVTGCIDDATLGATPSGRIELALRRTGLAPIVDTEVVACMVLQSDDDGASFDALVSGTDASPTTVAAFAVSLAVCAAPAKLAALLEVSVPLPAGCAAAAVAPLHEAVADLLGAYIVQDAAAGDTAAASLSAACTARDVVVGPQLPN